MTELNNGSYIATFGAGLIAGGSGIFIGHPFDTLKVRLQVGKPFRFQSGLALESKVSIISSIMQLYRGILPPLLTAGIIQSINFSIYEAAKRKVKLKYKNVSYLNSVFIGGVTSGAIISLLSCPIGIVKIKQQVVSKEGLFICAKEIFKLHGIKGFYRGYGVVFICDGIGRGIYLWLYEATKLNISKGYNNSILLSSQIDSELHIKDNLNTKILSACVAGVFSWLAVYPFDVIRSRLQYDLNSVQYNSIIDCTRKIWLENGIQGFFRGLSFTLIRAAPVAATILPIYEYSKGVLETLVV